MASAEEPIPGKAPPGRADVLVHAVALMGAAGLIALTAGAARWDLAPLAVIAVFAVASDLTSVDASDGKLMVSGSFLGLVLAAVLLGGSPAALVGMLVIAVGWFRLREAPHYLLNNLLTYAAFPLASGVFFHTTVRLAGIGPGDLSYYLVVFATFALALALNFAGIAGYQCYLDGAALTQKAREALQPLLSAELFSALLTLASVYVWVHLGATGLALFGVVLIVFQHLVGELLVSRRRSKELHRLATTDDLTGLANRESFRARLEEEIEASRATGASFAVFLVDLDRFKEINDTLGHDYGDALLRDLGPRLAECVGSGGLVARLGGDEFGVFSGQPTGEPDLIDDLATRLLASVHVPIVIDEMSLEVGASIGISRFPMDGSDPRSLLRCADIAMYAAKDTRSSYMLYSADQDAHFRERVSVLTEFRSALASEEIVVFYQPIVDLADRRVRGAEALVRWQHPELGLLAPAAFIDAVEQTDLIGPLTRHVLDEAISECARWRDADGDLFVAVNLSVRNLLDPGLPNDIDRMLSIHQLPPSSLRLEITERMIMSDPDRALEVVTRLTNLGVRLSVDDFGTGYSSLAKLRSLPIDELKIDRSIVSPMLHEESDLIMVRSTINLGHDLGLKTVAEGIEDEATLERLALLGCDFAQGYHLGRPMPAKAFERWIGDGGEADRPATSMSHEAGAVSL